MTVDLKGLSNSVLASEDASELFLDLSDTHFRTSDAVIGKWTRLLELESSFSCKLCAQGISVDVGQYLASRLSIRTTFPLPYVPPQYQSRASPVSTSLTSHVWQSVRGKVVCPVTLSPGKASARRATAMHLGEQLFGPALGGEMRKGKAITVEGRA